MTEPDTAYPKPSFKDWALLAVSVTFSLCGLIVLPHDLNVGIVGLALFGAGAALVATRILRKIRFRGFSSAVKAEIVGGVPIRRSRAVALKLGAVVMIMAILILFGRSDGIIIWASAWVIAVAGGALLVGVLCGHVANDYVQFDPEGITFGYRRFACTVPWDGIARVGAGYAHNNPAVFIWLHGFEVIRVRPAERRDRALKWLMSCARSRGAPIVLCTSQYEIDLPLLMMALERYLSDRSARAELARRLFPGPAG